MALFPIDSMRRRRSVIQQCHGFISLLLGRMQACDEHPCTEREVPEWLNYIQQVLDAWPLNQVEPRDSETQEKHSVWIIWGAIEKRAPTRYEFNTAVELAAFMNGVDQASGYLDYAQFNNQHAALASFYNELAARVCNEVRGNEQLIEDDVSLCDYVSRQFGTELTLAQAAELRTALENYDEKEDDTNEP